MLRLPTILPLLSAVFVLVLGFFAVRGKRAKLNIVFGLFCLGTFIWLLGTFMMFVSRTDEQAIFWDRFVYIGVVFMPMLVYHFSLVFSQIKGQKWLLALGYIFSCIFLVLSRTNYFVADLYKYSWGVHMQARFLHHIFLIFFVFYIFAAFLNILKSYRKPENIIKRVQAKYIFIAFLTLALVGSLAFLPAYGIDIYPLSYLSGVIFAIIVSYAILRYQFMDIRIVMRRGSVYALVAAFVYGFFYLVVWLLNTLFESVYAKGAMLLGVFLALLFVGLLFLFERFITRIANKYFFGGLYLKHEALRALTQKLTTIIDLKELAELITTVMKENLGLDKIAILLKQPDTKDFALYKTIGFEEENGLSLIQDNLLTQHLKQTGKPLTYEELDFRQLGNLKGNMERIHASLCLPLISKEDLIGIIVLGRKVSGDAFSTEDLGLLESLTNPASIAIENARLFFQVQDLSQNLQQKVKEQTKELQGLNQNLEQKVQERTKELEQSRQELQQRAKDLEQSREEIKERAEELEKFYKLTVGRELRMIELKKEIGALQEKLKEEQQS